MRRGAVAPTSPPDALSNPRSPAGKASGQRKARMAIYWAVQSPIPGSAWSSPMTASGSGPGSRSISRRATARAMAPDRRGARRRDPQRGQLSFLGGRQSCRRGAQSVQARERRLDRLAEAVREPAGESRRRPHRDALAQDGAHRQLEAVERARHAQARAASDDARQPRIDREVRGDHVRAARSSRRGSSGEPRTSGNAGMSDVASSTDRAFRPAIGSTFSQPR